MDAEIVHKSDEIIGSTNRVPIGSLIVALILAAMLSRTQPSPWDYHNVNAYCAIPAMPTTKINTPRKMRSVIFMENLIEDVSPEVS
jgi:hypothetical protein